MINFIRSLFCLHDYEFLEEVDKYWAGCSLRPYETKRIYMCRKCGHVKRIKIC